MATTQKKQAPKRKTVESTFADQWKPEAEGDELEGTYLGTEMVTSGRREPFRVHHIEDGEGKRWSISGAHLDSILSQVPYNSYVWVTYNGQTDTANGSMKLFKVDVDDSVELKDPYEKK